MTRADRRHDDFTSTVDGAAAHAARYGEPWADPTEHDPEPGVVAPMPPPPTCACGGPVVFSTRPGVWSECRDCQTIHRTIRSTR